MTYRASATITYAAGVFNGMLFKDFVSDGVNVSRVFIIIIHHDHHHFGPMTLGNNQNSIVHVIAAHLRQPKQMFYNYYVLQASNTAIAPALKINVRSQSTFRTSTWIWEPGNQAAVIPQVRG